MRGMCGVVCVACVVYVLCIGKRRGSEVCLAYMVYVVCAGRKRGRRRRKKKKNMRAESDAKNRNLIVMGGI